MESKPPSAAAAKRSDDSEEDGRPASSSSSATIIQHSQFDEKESSELSEMLDLTTTTDRLLGKDKDDLEAQRIAVEDIGNPVLAAAPVEYAIWTSKKMTFLGLYFFLNLGLTLSNKAVMQKARFPWLLTVMHTAATSIGCSGLLGMGHFKLSKLGTRENLVLVAFSVLFTLNIAVSNVSLALVSVPFHQVLRSTCPIATILIYRLFYSREYSRQTWLTMIPLISGVALATFGDYYFTLLGFALTLLGVLLASIKTVASNRLMTGTLKLSALEILFRMSPLAALQCLVYAIASGEITGLRAAIAEGTFDFFFIAALACNALMAFLLNIVSFQTNKVAGALTVSVCGNLKQTLTILLGIVLFNVTVTPLNGIGMLITAAGAAWYSKCELDTKRAKTVISAPS